MTHYTILTLGSLIGTPILNVGVLATITKLDQWFFVSLAYPAIFAVLLPLAILAAYWLLAKRVAKNPAMNVLPWLVSLVVVVCAIIHFLIFAAASASV